MRTDPNYPALCEAIKKNNERLLRKANTVELNRIEARTGTFLPTTKSACFGKMNERLLGVGAEMIINTTSLVNRAYYRLYCVLD